MPEPEPHDFEKAGRRLVSHVERAERILHVTLPEMRDMDHAIDNLYYVDPNNDTTRLHSIAAALYVLRVASKR